MHYLKLYNKDWDFHVEYPNLEYLLTEVDETGRIRRELGYTIDNLLVHKFPSNKFKHGRYGIFDLTPLETKNRKSDLTKEEFEKIWTETENTIS